MSVSAEIDKYRFIHFWYQPIITLRAVVLIVKRMLVSAYITLCAVVFTVRRTSV